MTVLKNFFFNLILNEKEGFEVILFFGQIFTVYENKFHLQSV